MWFVNVCFCGWAHQQYWPLVVCERERVFELWNRYSQKAHRPYIFVNRDWQWRIGESNRWKDLSCCCGELCTSTTQDNSHSLSHMHFICFPFWTVRERLPHRCKQNEFRIGVFNIINTHTLSLIISLHWASSVFINDHSQHDGKM